MIFSAFLHLFECNIEHYNMNIIENKVLMDFYYRINFNLQY